MILKPAKVINEMPLADLVLIKEMIWGIKSPALTTKLIEKPYWMMLPAIDMMNLSEGFLMKL